MQFRKRSCDEGLAFLCPGAVKNTERIENGTFQAFVEKVNHFAYFDD